MWPDQCWTPDEGANRKSPLHQDSNAGRSKENFRILAAPTITTGSVSQAPSDSTDDSIDFSELMTKPEKIIESPGAQDWDSDFAGLSNPQSAEFVNPSNRFQSDTKSFTSTSLSDSKSVSHSQNLGSEKSQSSHDLFFQEIITYSMENSSLQE